MQSILPESSSKELCVLLAASSLCTSSQTPDGLRAALRGELDWTRFVELILTHKSTPLVYKAFRRVSDAVPEDILAALAVHHGANRERIRVLLKVLHEVLTALAHAGADAIAFKGPPLALAAYGDVGSRQAGDLDLLVRRRDLDTVGRVLRNLGFRDDNELSSGRRLTKNQEELYRAYQCEYLYIRATDGACVEPHWAIVPKTLGVPPLDPDVWKRIQRIELDGGEVTVLDRADLLLALCQHAAKHEWSELRWISDVAALVAASPSMDWSAAISRARQQGSLRMLAIGLVLARGLLSCQLPTEVNSLIDKDTEASALAGGVARRLGDHEHKPKSVYRLSTFRLRMRERRRDAATHAMRTIFVPRIEHIRLIRLPKVLNVLYYPIKLAGDYLALPVVRVWRRRSQTKS